MKKTIKIFIIIAFYIGIIFIMSTKVYATTAKTIKDIVRLREEASTKSKTLQLLSMDQEVEIISKEGEWYKIEYTDGKNTYTGYVREDMLDVKEEETSNEEEQQNNQEEDKENNAVEDQVEDNTEDQQIESNVEQEVVQEIKENITIKTKNNIEIKILPSINSSKIGTINAKTQITITEIIGKWCYIETESQTGWVLISKIEQYVEEKNQEEENKNQESKNEEPEEENKTTEENNNETTNTSTEKTMYVSATTVNLREAASSSSKILEQISINTKVTVIEKVDDTWSKVQVSGITGYMATEYLSTEKTEVTSRGTDSSRDNSEESEEKDTTTSSNTSSSGKDDTTSNETNEESKTDEISEDDKTTSTKTTGADVVAYAKTFIGCKYVYGGTSPSGFDCSGFTQYVYKHFGYSLNRTSTDQRSNGIAVSKSNLKAGDLVCFNGHVGIYIGDNQFIHAENAANGVKISSLAEKYYTNNYVTARRIIY